MMITKKNNNSNIKKNAFIMIINKQLFLYIVYYT